MLYPSLSSHLLSKVEPALCPFQIPLPKKIKEEIYKVTKEFVEYKKEVAQTLWQDSVLNSLDFHYSSEKLKIIEANTNASGFLLSNLLLENQDSITEYEKILLQSFQSVFKTNHLKHIFIVDENPEGEKMFAEFLMFKDFFNRNNISSEIIPTSKITIKDSSLYIYNRDTDFYLKKNSILKALWLSKKAHLSSSPYSYQNIADKKFNMHNLEPLNKPKYQSLKQANLKTLSLNTENKSDVWARRKNFFFKPSSAFGSKGVYSGKSVSRTKFNGFKDGYLAQELHLPGKILHNEVKWKFDIRAFFSENGVQKIITRVYQGQLTNFSNLGGGFALIRWID